MYKVIKGILFIATSVLFVPDYCKSFLCVRKDTDGYHNQYRQFGITGGNPSAL